MSYITTQLDSTLWNIRNIYWLGLIIHPDQKRKGPEWPTALSHLRKKFMGKKLHVALRNEQLITITIK